MGAQQRHRGDIVTAYTCRLREVTYMYRISYQMSALTALTALASRITHHASRSQTDWHHASRIHDITHNRTICLFRCSAISRPTFVFSSSHSHHGCALCLSLSLSVLCLVQCIDLTTTTIC